MNPGSPGQRVLFLSRRYPPTIGGVQTHCLNLYTRLRQRQPTTLVALRYESLLHLGWFLPYAWCRAALSMVRRTTDVVYFSDGVICALAPFLKPFSRGTRFVVTHHGMELTFDNRPARWLIRWASKCCSRIVAVSENTWNIAHRCGLPAAKMSVIYAGISPHQLTDERAELIGSKLEESHSLRFGVDPILLNLGRQVRRKGLAPFLEYGFPLLDEEVRLVIAGSGPELTHIRRLVGDLGVGGKVSILGEVDDDVAAFLRHKADLFIMPNIPLAEDIEGFGLALLESMLARTPVVAFAVDALVESVREGGYLIEPGDYEAFARQIRDFLTLSPGEREAVGKAARAYVTREYEWDRTADQYARLFSEA